MDIKEFFELSVGKWFAQRTNYNLEPQQAQSSKSDITFELLSATDPELISLCQEYQVEAVSTWGGGKISWDTSPDWGKPKQVGYSILVPISDQDNRHQGTVLRLAHNKPSTALKIRYVIGKDEALTLTAQGKETYAQERLWFASPNLRLRTSLERNNRGYSSTSFYSEIRRMETN